jgi:hypothetical protein
MSYTHTVRQFDSVHAAVAASEALHINGESSTRDDHSGWSGASWQDALSMAKTGWSDVRPKVDAILEPVRDALKDILSDHPDRMLDMVGFEPDVDRFVMGELECMWDEVFLPQNKAGKVFTLLVNGVYDSGVQPETVFARGAAISALVEAFTLLGYELEIFVECSVSAPNYKKKSYRDKRPEWSFLTKIHNAGEPMDINNVMFALGHPAWLRRICFGVMEGQGPKMRADFGFGCGGYGTPTGGTLCDSIVNPSFTMMIGGSNYGQDITDPVGWVLGQLEIQGVWERPQQ